MKKKPVKECIIFGIIAVIAAIMILGSARIGTTKYYPAEGDEKVQILFLGDSNLAYDFGDKTIPQRLEERMDVTVYNCAAGGTSAAKINSSNFFDFSFDLLCLHNLIKVMECEDHQPLLDFYADASVNERGATERMEILADIDYESLDYIVVAYGLNDYVSGRPVYGEDPYDIISYAGALRTAIESLQRTAPNAKIIVSSITYCIFYENGAMAYDGYEKSYDGGYINEYRDAAKMVATEYDNVYFLDNLELLEINRDNSTEYLRDGMHLTVAGQELYTDNLEEIITKIESENNG